MNHNGNHALTAAAAAAAPPTAIRGAMAGTGTFSQEALVGLVSGAAFGLVSPIIGHPFDLIKTKMQACTSVHQSATIRETVKVVYVESGLKGFYRGFIPPLIGSIAFRSLQFSAYSGGYAFCERYVPVLHNPIPFTGGLQASVLCGAMFAAFVRSVIETPLEFVKVRAMVGKTAMQDDHHGGAKRSSLQMVSQSAKNFARQPIVTIQHFYHGFTPTLLRTMGLLVSFFVLADYSVRYIPDVINAPFIGPFFKGGVCATLSWAICFPFENAKSVIQADHTGQFKHKPFATWHVLKLLYQQNGVRAVYRGFGPGASRSFVANGISMIVYAWFQDALRSQS